MRRGIATLWVGQWRQPFVVQCGPFEATLLIVAILSVALATPVQSATGRVSVDAKLPTEILVDGQKVGQLYREGEVAFSWPVGSHMLRVFVNGAPTDLPIEVNETTPVHVLVGRTGTTAVQVAPPEATDSDGQTAIAFRLAGTSGARVRVGTNQLQLGPAQQPELTLAVGSYPFSARSEDGTIIWASGTLEVLDGERIFVQVSEGRMPEVSGSGQFHPGG